VWTADITYVPTSEGWLYVAAIKDLFAGEIVGRSFGQRMTTELVVRAFGQAVSARRPAPGLIHHSDRGSQYCSHEYQELLASYGMRVSMSRKGNCYDNAPIESFWGTLKTELVHHRRYRTRAEAAREIAEYIDLFYNRQRRQARLRYLSPVAYTQLFTRQQRAACTSHMASTFDDLPQFKLVPFVIDAHDEGRKWSRLRSAVRLLDGAAQGIGIPAGGGLIYCPRRASAKLCTFGARLSVATHLPPW
jgi:hypothetical protein